MRNQYCPIIAHFSLFGDRLPLQEFKRKFDELNRMAVEKEGSSKCYAGALLSLKGYLEFFSAGSEEKVNMSPLESHIGPIQGC